MTDIGVINIYKKIDKIIQTEKNCCKKGCSFCCYQQIEIMNIEKKVINDFIKKNLDRQKKEIIIENLTTWLDFFNQNTPNNKVLNSQDVFIDFRNKCAKQKLMCPFLINNFCSIYEMRPVACRAHYVEDFPNLCDESNQRMSPQKGIVLINYIIEKLKLYKDISIEPLAYSVKSILLPGRKLKQIEKVCI